MDDGNNVRQLAFNMLCIVSQSRYFKRCNHCMQQVVISDGSGLLEEDRSRSLAEFIETGRDRERPRSPGWVPLLHSLVIEVLRD